MARDKAVQEAVQIGALNPSNSEAVRMNFPTPELPTSIEEDEINDSSSSIYKQKRFESLAKARACKKRNTSSSA